MARGVPGGLPWGGWAGSRATEWSDLGIGNLRRGWTGGSRWTHIGCGLEMFGVLYERVAKAQSAGAPSRRRTAASPTLGAVVQALVLRRARHIGGLWRGARPSEAQRCDGVKAVVGQTFRPQASRSWRWGVRPRRRLAWHNLMFFLSGVGPQEARAAQDACPGAAPRADVLWQMQEGSRIGRVASVIGKDRGWRLRRLSL